MGMGAPPEPSTTAPTATTSAPAVAFAGIGETVLVTADDGVYQIGADGDVTLLVGGAVAYAVDDTQGGLLFQVDRGRVRDDEHGSSTIVWWIPKGASTPQELLVPTPGAGQRLSLHDAYATDDGFAVLYVRHEGVTPELIDRLRRFDSAAREVTELHSEGAWEAGFGDVSSNGELIAGVWVQQIGSQCFIKDLDGEATDLNPPEASDLGLTSDDYVRGCRLSPDGRHLSFFTVQDEDNELVSTTLHSWDLDADQEAARLVVPGSYGFLGVLDVSATRTVASFADHGGKRQQALVFDLNAPAPDPVALPIAGAARFVDTPVDIAAPVHVGAGPNYYRFGDDGLYRVVDGVETQLETKPVIWAVDDLTGGVIYRFHWQLDPETTYWRKADGSQETFGNHHPQFVASIEGEPTAVMMASDEWDADGFDQDVDLLLVGLRSGAERRLPNIGFDGDGWSFPRSYGDGLFVGVDGAAFGCGYSDTFISFWDGDGRRIDHQHNPVAEPCGPCELSAAISPDGRLLAYSKRADAPSEYHGRLVCGGLDDWWVETQEIPSEVVVLDLDTGREVFRVTVPAVFRTTSHARPAVADFDGRYVAVEQEDYLVAGSVTIYDTWGMREPVEVEGGVALIRREPTAGAISEIVLRHDGLGVASFGDLVDDVMAVLTEHLGVPTYDQTYESPFQVPVDWAYGDRGIYACHGATHGNICFDYIRFVGWGDLGLSVLFSDIEANPESTPDDDGYWTQVPPSFRGWGYGGNPGAPLHTAHGITVGSTTQDLLSLGPIVTFNWDGCGWQAGFAIAGAGRADEGRIYGLLSYEDFEAFEETGIPREDARVLSLNAGQSGSC
jgi:hypothetical protein